MTGGCAGCVGRRFPASGPCWPSTTLTCSRALEAGRTGDAWTPGGGYEPVAGLALHPRGETTVQPLIPDLSHFCPFHGLGETVKAILEHVAGARVWVIRP